MNEMNPCLGAQSAARVPLADEPTASKEDAFGAGLASFRGGHLMNGKRPRRLISEKPYAHNFGPPSRDLPALHTPGRPAPAGRFVQLQPIVRNLAHCLAELSETDRLADIAVSPQR